MYYVKTLTKYWVCDGCGGCWVGCHTTSSRKEGRLSNGSPYFNLSDIFYGNWPAGPRRSHL